MTHDRRNGNGVFPVVWTKPDELRKQADDDGPADEDEPADEDGPAERSMRRRGETRGYLEAKRRPTQVPRRQLLGT